MFDTKWEMNNKRNWFSNFLFVFFFSCFVFFFLFFSFHFFYSHCPLSLHYNLIYLNLWRCTVYSETNHLSSTASTVYPKVRTIDDHTSILNSSTLDLPDAVDHYTHITHRVKKNYKTKIERERAKEAKKKEEKFAFFS